MPLTTVDYSGGIIITDWYSDSNSSNESIKITVRFLSNEVQSNSVKIIVHNKKCAANENCRITEIDSKIKFMNCNCFEKSGLWALQDRRLGWQAVPQAGGCGCEGGELEGRADYCRKRRCI